MRIYQLTVEEAFRSLRSNRAGLSNAEAQRRLTEFGPNLIPEQRRTSSWGQFLKGFTHFFAIVLWIAAALAFMADALGHSEGMRILGGAIIGVIVVNNAFSFWQEYRAEQTLKALQKLLPDEVLVVREGRTLSISVAALVPGDLVLLKTGENVPADCRITEGFGLQVNTATLTGESLPQSRGSEPSDAADYLVSRNILLAGTAIVAGEGCGLVFATGPHSAFGEIARLAQASKEPASPLQKEIRLLSRWVAVLAVGLGGVFLVVGQQVGLPFWQSFLFAIGIIVANVPEGLLPTVTLALAIGSQRMARRNALVRHLPAVETLGAATVICTDKTGTLTENKMTARCFYVGDRYFDCMHSIDWPNAAAMHRRFFEAALLCQNVNEALKDRRLQDVGDPMEVALIRLAEKALSSRTEFQRVAEIPFDSDRRRLSTLHRTPDGLLLFVKGAPEVILELCSEAEKETGIVPLDVNTKKALRGVEDAMADRGYRVIAFAYRHVPEHYDTSQLEQNLVFAGFAGLEDPPRKEVPAAIQKCEAAGIRVIMVTGDHPHTAKAIARQTGITKTDTPLVLTGSDLRKLSSSQLQLALDTPEIIFARVAAAQKTRIVEALQNKQHVVAVTGDGVNDAPALRRADIGVAMGVGGTDVAREAADIVLLDDNFATIVAAIEEGRAIFANIRKFLTYILTSNIPEIIPYLAFGLFRIPLPLTVIQILAVDLGTDLLPALALGAEAPNPQVMNQPPRPRQERLINLKIISRAYLWLGPIQAIAAMGAFFFVLKSGGWSGGQTLPSTDALYRQATTASLTAIVIMQVANVFICRSRRESAFRFRFADNKLILAGVFAEIALILLINYTPVGNIVFGTNGIGPTVWLLIVASSIAMLLLEEVRKWFVRRIWKVKALSHREDTHTQSAAPGYA